MSSRFPFHERRSTCSRVRLLCFPFAGGSAMVFRDWANLLPDWIEVCAFELPGRAGRRAERPCTSMTELLDDIERGLVAIEAAAGPRKLALFGHSLGGRVAHALAARASRPLEHLFVSAATPPSVSPRLRSAMPDFVLTEELRRLGGTPAEVLDDDDLMQSYFPVLRADLQLVEQPSVVAPLTIPITAFSGGGDREVPPHLVAQWSESTANRFAHVVLEGASHFFLDSHAEDVLGRLTRDLAAASPSP